MTKRLLVIAAPVAVVALALSISAMAAGSGKATTAKKGTVLSVVEHATTDATAHVGPKADNRGDLLTFANQVFNAKDTKPVGSDQGTCIRVVVGAAYECNWTNLLPGGHLVVEGPFYDKGDSTLAIIGGTGKYETARGSMKLHSIGNGAKYSFVFHIRH